MRILQVTSKFPFPAVDGGSIASLAMAQGLHTSGATIDLFSLNTVKHQATPQEIDQLRRKEYYNLIRKSEIDTTPSIYKALKNKWGSKSNYYIERYYSEECWNDLSQMLRLNDYEIIILDHLNTSIYLHLIRDQVDCPIIIRTHNVESELRERMNAGQDYLSKRLLKSEVRSLKKYEVEILNHSDLLVNVSHRDGVVLRNQGVNTRMHTAPIGIAAQENSYRPPSDQFKIGFIGSLDWKPNLLGLYWFVKNVWPVVVKKHEDIELHIAGSYLKSRPEWFNMNSIYYHGRVADSLEFTNGMNLMIVPLWTGSGTRVKIIEAMSVRVPVLSTVLGAEGLDISNKKEAWITDQKIEWVDLITTIVFDRDMSEAVAASAMEYVSKVHDPELIGKNLMVELKKLRN